MSATSDMSTSRQDAIRLMRFCGWTHTRPKSIRHEFRRPDGDGLLDVVSVSHNNLSLNWAVLNCRDKELESRVFWTRRDWMKETFAKMAEERPQK